MYGLGPTTSACGVPIARSGASARSALAAGPEYSADRAQRRERAMGTPHADVVGPSPYTGFQAAFDPLLAPGARNYWKTHNFAALDDALIDTLAEQVGGLPGPMCEIFLAHLGGAVSRVADDATAYMGRDAQFVMNVHARWDEQAQDDRFVTWARSVYQATAPYAAAGAYVNFMTADEQDRVRAAYGPNYDRLAAIKAKYDPTNVFKVNQNVRPAGPQPASEQRLESATPPRSRATRSAPQSSRPQPPPPAP